MFLFFLNYSTNLVLLCRTNDGVSELLKPIINHVFY